MKLIKIKLFIVAMLIFLHGNQCDAEGFLAGTIVKTPNGYTKIEDLHIGDYVICYDKQKNYVESKIVCTDKKSIERYVRIAIAAEYLCLACDQKLYKKEDDVWIVAVSLKKGDVLADRVISVELKKEPVDVYLLSVATHHNFFVTKSDLCAHNFFSTDGFSYICCIWSWFDRIGWHQLWGCRIRNFPWISMA